MKRVAEQIGERGSQGSYSNSLVAPRTSTISDIYGFSVGVFSNLLTLTTISNAYATYCFLKLSNE